MAASLPVLLLVPLLSQLGCVPKTGVVSAERSLDVTVVAAREPMDQARVEPVPTAVSDGILAALKARNLHPTLADPSTWQDAFTHGRTTRFRVAHVAVGSQADLVLVTETWARYGSQLGGRYQWTVQVTVSLAPVAHPEQVETSSFEVPVFLQYYHQQEAEAVEAAAPVIERRVGSLLDQYLGGLEAQ